MNRLQLTQANLIALAFAFVTTGCALPTLREGKPASTPAIAATPPDAGPAVPPRTPAAASTAVRGPQQTPPPAAPVSQVGHFVPARLATPCGCGATHGACEPADCQACRPHGYVMMSPEGWNAYGIDGQEFLCDGGDQLPPAVVTVNDSVAGLGLEDTVVHYTTTAGDIHVQPSNRACLYAPRFSAVRKITGAVAGGRAVGLRGVDRPVGPIRVEQDLPGLVMTDSTELAHADVARRIDAMRELNRGVPVEGILQPEQAADVMAALAALKLYDLGQLRDREIALLEQLALAAIPWTVDESLEVAIADVKPPTLIRDEHLEGFTIYEFPDAGRLRIVKMADRADALPGEIVTFVIRIDNVGDSAVNNVVLVDNLTTRLEYVPDSQSCEGAEAEFEATPNEGQSSKLRWAIQDELQVGDSVTIRFECKVR